MSINLISKQEFCQTLIQQITFHIKQSTAKQPNFRKPKLAKHQAKLSNILKDPKKESKTLLAPLNQNQRNRKH